MEQLFLSDFELEELWFAFDNSSDFDFPNVVERLYPGMNPARALLQLAKWRNREQLLRRPNGDLSVHTGSSLSTVRAKAIRLVC